MRLLLDHEATCSAGRESGHECALLLRAVAVLPNDRGGYHMDEVGRRNRCEVGERNANRCDRKIWMSSRAVQSINALRYAFDASICDLAALYSQPLSLSGIIGFVSREATIRPNPKRRTAQRAKALAAQRNLSFVSWRFARMSALDQVHAVAKAGLQSLE